MSVAPLDAEEAAMFAAMENRSQRDREAAVLYLRIARCASVSAVRRQRSLEVAADLLVGEPS